MAAHNDKSEISTPGPTSPLSLFHTHEPLSQDSLLQLLELAIKTDIAEPISFQLQDGVYFTCLESIEEKNPDLFSVIEEIIHQELIDNKLTIAMSSTVHAVLCTELTVLLGTELDRLKNASEGATKDLVTDIHMTVGRRRVRFGKNFMEPNILLFIIGQRPGIVVDVAWSKTLKSLSERAKVLLNRMNGQVRLYIGVKSRYRVGHDLTVYIWRYGQEEPVEHKLIENGTTCPGSINLKLRDFAPAAVFTRYPNANIDTELVVGYEQLVRFLRTAIECEERDPDYRDKHRASDKISPRIRPIGSRAFSTYPSLKPTSTSTGCSLNRRLPLRTPALIGGAGYRLALNKDPLAAATRRGLSFCLSALPKFRR